MQLFFAFLCFLAAYAGICCAIYALCRWLEWGLGSVYYSIGAYVFFTWFGMYLIFGLLFMDSGHHPARQSNVLDGKGIWSLPLFLLTFVGGSWLHRRCLPPVTDFEANFCEGMFASAFYLGVIWVSNLFLYYMTEVALGSAPADNPWMRFSSFISQNIWGVLLLWFFPIGAPLSWIVLRKLRKLHQGFEGTDR